MDGKGTGAAGTNIRGDLILRQFNGVFKIPGEPIGRTDRVRHTINVGGAAPIRQRLRKVPIHQQALVEAELECMLADQVIELT